MLLENSFNSVTVSPRVCIQPCKGTLELRVNTMVVQGEKRASRSASGVVVLPQLAVTEQAGMVSKASSQVTLSVSLPCARAFQRLHRPGAAAAVSSLAQLALFFCTLCRSQLA
jgi:hypothetical protein